MFTAEELLPVKLTLELALITTVFLLLVATPLAWWLSHTKSKWRAPISSIVTLPLVLPPSVLGFYLLVAMGPSGPLGKLTEALGIGLLTFTFPGLVIGSIVYSMPFAVQPLQAAFESIGKRPLEVAATVGAKPMDAFFNVVLPLAKPGFVTAALLTFAHTIGEFGVVLMIGGNVPGKTQVVSTEIYSYEEAMEYSTAHWLAGGMVTDLGGFAAATFKRGIAYINIPTTLLAMVDASVGGKTGINFNGLKNEIGVFAPASSVLLETGFLRSLDARNFFSGYAEMLKHGLISTSDHLAELLSFDTENIDYSALRTMVGRSVQVKEDIVEQDPKEHGIRKALNLGHTIGHAFESLALAENRPVLHGYAVAWGLVCELYLSYLKAGFPKDKMRQTIQFIKENYGAFAFSCKQYDSLYELMLHDKKNTAGIINFTLLKEVGDICLNQTADKETIFEVFDFYRECMGV